MVEPLDGMPEGTIGFRATGRVTRAEYHDLLLPAMKAAAEAGEVQVFELEQLDEARDWAAG